MSEPLEWLQKWYANQCNGDWEHMYGVRICTLDNPGWRVEIDLAETALADVVISRVMQERSEHDWISYDAVGNKFSAAGGPLCLGEIIKTFRHLWEKQSNERVDGSSFV